MTDNLEYEYKQRYKHLLLPLAEKLERHIRECLSSQPRVDRIVCRAKSIDRFLEKAARLDGGAHRYSDPLNQIQDQIGARIVTHYVDDVEPTSRAVLEYFRHIEEQSIVPDSESEFGYFGKHFVLLIPEDVIPEGIGISPPFFELQVKTLFQHAWAEANHDLGYKPGFDLSAEDRRKIAFTSAQAWGADMIFNQLYNKGLIDGAHED